MTVVIVRTVFVHLSVSDLLVALHPQYQFWCEEASATIARVGTFSLECRSTEAVSVLYRQFEKFVWPTVPQQEERISQITELAVRLHGGQKRDGTPSLPTRHRLTPVQETFVFSAVTFRHKGNSCTPAVILQLISPPASFLSSSFN